VEVGTETTLIIKNLGNARYRSTQPNFPKYIEIDRMIETRQQYFQVLTDTIYQTENYISRYPELSIYTNILTQLLFIQNIIMNEKEYLKKMKLTGCL
jgi:hypothetical protein